MNHARRKKSEMRFPNKRLSCFEMDRCNVGGLQVCRREMGSDLSRTIQRRCLLSVNVSDDTRNGHSDLQ